MQMIAGFQAHVEERMVVAFTESKKMGEEKDNWEQTYLISHLLNLKC